MDIQGVIKEIEGWPIEQRFQLLETLWENLSDYAPTFTDEQREEFGRRLDRYDQNPSNVVSWEQVQLNLKRVG